MTAEEFYAHLKDGTLPRGTRYWTLNLTPWDKVPVSCFWDRWRKIPTHMAMAANGFIFRTRKEAAAAAKRMLAAAKEGRHG